MVKISVIGICGKSTFMYVDHFHQNGETVSADTVFEEMGGKGINQAVAAARMGAEVSFLCAVGTDVCAKECYKVTKENKIHASFVVKEDKTTTFAFILTDKSGENRVTVYRGAELCVEDVIAFSNEIAQSDVLLIQNEVPPEVNEKAVEIATENGVKVILNPAPVSEISDKIVQTVFAVIPNEHEKQAIDVSKFKNCITTLGDKGCSINDRITVPAIKQDTVDTTGAGDTFNGVLAVCIAEEMDIITSCKYAVTASGISVSKKYVLNSIPYREDIERMLKNE